jgi:hypothetical protein
MIEDDIIREIRATREAFAAAHGYDVRAMVETLRKKDAAAGRQVVQLPPRPVPRAAESGLPTALAPGYDADSPTEDAMSKLTLPPEAAAALRTATGPCELFDPSGRSLGRYIPTARPDPFPDIDYAELERTRLDPNTKWVTPEQVMERLRSLRKSN